MANIINEIKRSANALNSSREEYVVPSYPIELFPSDFQKPRYGKDMLKYFKLDKSITFLNHGSYGALPIPISNVQRSWQDLLEENPVQFLSNNMFTYLYDAMRDVAKYINADAEDIVFVDNATSGCNTVLKSLKYKEGENIVYLSIEYGAIMFTIEYVASRYNLEKKMIKVDFPIDIEKVLQDFENAIDSNTKICVIDHLTSSTGIVLPIKRFIDIAHKKGTMILVDAAHSIGHVPIDIKDLDPDFYTSNFHKWLYAPRASAFLYVNKKYRDQIVPLSISHGQNYSLNSRFSFTGTRDYTPFLCLKSCFKFFEAIGGEEAHAYQRTLVREAYQLLVTKFGTGGILTRYQDEYMGKFALIKLPKSNVDYPGNTVGEKAVHIQNLLYEKYKIEIPFNVLNDELYVRISAQVYNELSEYEYLANSILELFKIV